MYASALTIGLTSSNKIDCVRPAAEKDGAGKAGFTSGAFLLHGTLLAEVLVLFAVEEAFSSCLSRLVKIRGMNSFVTLRRSFRARQATQGFPTHGISGRLLTHLLISSCSNFALTDHAS